MSNFLDQQRTAFLREVGHEHVRAIEKFPNSQLSMSATAEEFGELAKALLEEPSVNVYKEAVQLASMAMRIAIEGDPTHDDYREANGLDRHPNWETLV